MLMLSWIFKFYNYIFYFHGFLHCDRLLLPL